MSVKPTSSMKRRLNIIIAFLLLAFLVWIIINLVNVSITNSKEYQDLANKQQFQTTVIHANRGSIYDTNLQILAQSATVYTIFVDPVAMKENDLEKLDIICEKLSEILNVDAETIRKSALKENRYQEIKKKVEKPIADKVTALILEHNLTSIGCTPDTKRYYPQNDLAASVIGFTGFDGDGTYGLEAYYDDYLAGTDGKVITAKDAKGNEMPYRYEMNYPAKVGDSLVLNIDITLQHYLEKELKNAITTHAARNRGCGIIMNAKTGAILAMASEQDFDLNNPTEITDPTIAAYVNSLEGDEKTTEKAIAWEKQWKNKAITELYYPGSVFKVITGSSALEEKAISLESYSYTCSYVISVADRTFHCWNDRGHGTQNFVQAMTNSCNPAFVDIGQKLGAELFCQYFNAYGLNKKTGIDLPGEVSSIYIGIENMGKVELASSSFGQTNKITPIEMITAYAAVVNGGNLVTPYVVNKIIDVNGNIVKTFEPQIKRQVISEETSKIMRDTLETVVNVNGGSNAYIKGYQIGGKSGTSQKIDQDITTGRKDYVSSYVGFAPADDPEIIMLVMVDEPTGGKYYGSLVAAPVVSAVFKEALPYLGYFPEYTVEELESMEISLPVVEGIAIEKAKNTLINSGLNVDVVGNGTTVIKQIPAGGNQIPRSGKIILYTEEDYDEEYVTVPNVINMSLQDANVEITNAGLNIKPTGGAANQAGAYAMLQNYNGVEVPRGTIIEVMFVADTETG